MGDIFVFSAYFSSHVTFATISNINLLIKIFSFWSNISVLNIVSEIPCMRHLRKMCNFMKDIFIGNKLTLQTAKLCI